MTTTTTGGLPIPEDTDPLGQVYAYMRALAAALDPGWVAYTPTWRTSGTQPTLGDGTLVGRACKVGRVCHFRMALRLGSTTNPGTGGWTFDLPYPAALASSLGGISEGHVIAGAGTVLNFGTKNYPQAYANPITGTSPNFNTRIQALVDNHAGTLAQATNTYPFAWGVQDVYSFAGTYEIA